MMNRVITVSKDYEQIITDMVREYLYKDIKFAEVYPNFGNVRVEMVHPFAYFVDNQVNDAPIPQGLFPSITIVSDNDQKNPEVDTQTHLSDIKITTAEILDIKENRKHYIMSDENLAALDQLTQGTSFVWAKGFSQLRRASVVFEIWDLNPKVKNALYDLTMFFLLGTKRFTLNVDYDIVIDEKSISGEKSGNYNYDFGKMLHGGMIRCSVDFSVSQYVIDTETLTAANVIHTVEEVKND